MPDSNTLYQGLGSFALLINADTSKPDLGASFKPKVGKAGTGCWSKTILDFEIFVLDELSINDLWRGKGVGSWVLSQLFNLTEYGGPYVSWIFARHIRMI